MAKKILAMLLAFGLLATALVIPAAAASTETKDKKPYKNPNGCTKENPCDVCSPCIILPGIGQSNTVMYKDGKPTELGGDLVFPDTSNMKLAPVIFSLIGSLLLQHDIGLTKSVYKLICGLFEPQRVEKNGKHVHDLRTNVIGRVSEMDEDVKTRTLNVYVPVHEVLEFAGEDHVYFFAFNLVGEVLENVKLLEEYIDFVIEETGHSKVNLINLSLGGTLFTGYLEYGDVNKLDQVVNVVSAWDGTDMLADLMSHKVNRDPSFLYSEWLPMMFGTDLKIADGWNATIAYIANLVIRIFPNKLFEGIISAAWKGILDTIVVNCTQFWAMVPADRYKEIADMYLVGDEYKALREKTDLYHTAQKNRDKNVLEAVKQGVHINSIAGSGLSFGDVEYTFFAAAESTGKINSDGIVGVKNASGGATAAAPGEKLPADYVPKKAGYISPDNTVDCSTAVLPDNTWIFLDQHHEVGRNDAVLHLASAIIKNPGMDINSDPKNFPQFNYAMNTNDLRRRRLNEANALLEKGGLSADAEKKLKAAIAEGEAVRALTVGDPKRAAEATEALNALLREYGELAPAYEQNWFQRNIEKYFAWRSDTTMDFYGKNGYSEVWAIFHIWPYLWGKITA